MELSKDLKSRQEVRDLAEAASKAQTTLMQMEQRDLDRIVQAMAKAAADHALELAKLAKEETGYGSVPDKEQKNRFASETVWETIKNQKLVGLLHQDQEKKIWEIGVPVGVIAGIVPSTNPTSTAIYKSLIALKSGNAIIFSPHPGAKKCTLRAIEILTEAAEQAGCPKSAIGCISIPTMEAVEELMKHPKVRLILATGGPAMVQAAYSSGNLPLELEQGMVLHIYTKAAI